MKKPKIINPCADDRNAGSGEKIIEITFPDGTSCLISIRELMGIRSVEIYQANADVTVRADGDEIELKGE